MKEKKLVPKRRFAGFENEWIKNSLGDSVKITMGHSPESSTYTSTPTDYILVQGNADLKNNRVVPRVWTTKVTKTAEKGDLIISVRAPVGDIAKTDYNVVLGRGVAGIKGNEFIFQLLTKMKIESFWSKISTGSTFDSINSSDLANSEIVIPNLIEQQKVGEFFKQLDQMITLEQRKLEKTKALKSAYLAEMFPAEGERVPKRRFAGFRGEWEERKIGEIVEVFDYGLNASATTFDGINKYIRITDIDEKTRVFSENDLTSPKCDLNNAETYLLQKGDILFARTGASVGKTYFYDEKDGRVFFAGFLIRARIKSEFEVGFIFQNTLTDHYRSFVKITSQRSGQPGINVQEYAGFKIKIPRIQEQQKISSFFVKLDDSIRNQQQKLDKLKAMKQAYLQEMFV